MFSEHPPLIDVYLAVSVQVDHLKDLADLPGRQFLEYIRYRGAEASDKVAFIELAVLIGVGEIVGKSGFFVARGKVIAHGRLVL